MSAQLYQQFKAAAEGVGAQVQRVATPTLALERAGRILEEWEAGQGGKPLQVVWRRGVLSGALPLPAAIQGKIWEKDLYLYAEAATIGIAEADWAIADTGTLVQDATDPEKRYVTTLPELNILLVSTARLLPDMQAALALVRPEEIPFLAFITGPSRTADIERVLTLGVHGPEWLHIIFIDEGGN